ncbi:hypothetical protein ACSS31_27700 (plasmid) [Priestia megaterium]
MKVSATKLSTTIFFVVFLVSFMLYITIQNNIHTRENTIKEYINNLPTTTDLENKSIDQILNTNKKDTFFLLLKTNTSDKGNILVPIGLKKDLLGWKSFSQILMLKLTLVNIRLIKDSLIYLMGNKLYSWRDLRDKGSYISHYVNRICIWYAYLNVSYLVKEW